MNDENLLKDLTVDIVIGGVGAGGETLSNLTQKALLASFKTAANLDDLAARLVIPIPLVAVTGVKVVSARGYDAYKITVAIRSDDPNLVAKTIFSTGVGLFATVAGKAIFGLVSSSFTPIAGAVVGWSAGFALGYAAERFASNQWDESLGQTAAGQWTIGQLTDTFSIGLKVTAGALTASDASVPPANQAPDSMLLIDPASGLPKVVFNTNPTRRFDPDVAVGQNTYTVQKGDSLWKIAAANGWRLEDLIAANPQLTDPNFINVGQKINGLASVKTLNTVTVVTHTTALAAGNKPVDPGTSTASDGVAASSFDYTASMNASVLNNGTAYWEGIQSHSLTGGFRPGNHNLSDTAASIKAVAQAFDRLADFKSVDQLFRDAVGLTNAGVNTPLIPADPLVLDLNGNGVELINYTDSRAYFDIDNDGGSVEHTGWVSPEDGMVVHDLNSNGVIDNISETLSEYYNGAAGTGGNAGTRLYADGFAALASLDSNGDKVFDQDDAAWSDLRIWVDANVDGKSFKDTNNNGLFDAGEVSELKTFDELGVTSIRLAATAQSGLINGGNEVLATGSFTQSGQTKAAQAVKFIANPNGATFGVTEGGAVITSQGNDSTADIKSYVSTNADAHTNETLSAQGLGVSHLYGGAGNDVLQGDTDANWLAGNAGSDYFYAGAGDDVLLIDADDLQAHIHAGAGNDVVQVVGGRGVRFSLSQAEVEVAIGGRGNDVLVGGGSSTVFIRGGDGDDSIIGGAASDVLSGDDGADVIDGGAGNDMIRGQRGQDQLAGSSGDDVLDGGLEDDFLTGGSGNDVLIGGQGDDALDGGEGIDVAQFSGSYADYRLTRLSDANNQLVYRIVNQKTGRDGADILTNIEKLSFADISAIDITLDNPMPVKDVITIDSRQGVKLIRVAHLLANDRDWQGDALRLTRISDVKGGTVAGTKNALGEITPTLTANGEISFTPDPSYTGVMGFKYQVADLDGTPGATIMQVGVAGAAEVRAQVFIKTPDMPADALMTDQWYLSEINGFPVWKDYTGKGIKIAQFEPGGLFATGDEILDYRHPDLAANIDAAWLADKDHVPGQSFSQHATLVAGVIAASRNDEGVVGIAYGATIAGYNIGKTVSSSSAALAVGDFAHLNKLKDYDVSNHSWGLGGQFEFFSSTTPSIAEAYFKPAVVLGRQKLGSNIVLAGGNNRQGGGNTNYSELTANRYVITTGAINARGDLSTLTVSEAAFSNRGASILVSAPGSNMTSTGRLLTGDDGAVFGSDNQTAQGTSLAAPIITGVVALMLEANPNLGYRDVQQILALTARKVNDPATDTVYNGAVNWNGGGMRTSHDYGFGEVDARAAVRLAETWDTQHTAFNERHLTRAEGSINGAANLNLAIRDGATVTRTLAIGAGVCAEHVNVTIDVLHNNWGDLTVELISPTGTVSKLVANPGANLISNSDMQMRQLKFTFDTTHSWGENAQGNWQLRIIDRVGGGKGTLNGWKVDVYGSDLNETADGWRTGIQSPILSAKGNNQYFYTDEFGTAPGTARATLNDTNNGYDTLNAAALSGNAIINLNKGTVSNIAGRTLTVMGDIEKAIGGDGNDTITGNLVSNFLIGERGNDHIDGGGAADLLDGGRGNDSLTGGQGDDYFVVHKEAGSTTTVTDFNPVEREKILFVGFENMADFSDVAVVQEGLNVRLQLADSQSVLLLNTRAEKITEQGFGFLSNDFLYKKYIDYISVGPGSYYLTDAAESYLIPAQMTTVRVFAMGGDDIIGATTSHDFIDGGDGHDTVWGDYPGSTAVTGQDWIEGGGGNDTLYGGEGADWLSGGSGRDWIEGEAGGDGLHGASGDDVLLGGAGKDTLSGGAGNDYLDGGDGDDIIALEGDFGTVTLNQFMYYGTRVGGAGADVFFVTKGGGGNSGFAADASGFSASNLIADFDVTQAGELIDLSALNWIQGFADLSIQSLMVNGTPFTRVTAARGTDGLAINLLGVSAQALHAGHFKFVVTPGLVLGGLGNDQLAGDAGANIMDGGSGADTMAGRTGDDTYIVDHVGDSIIELPGGGFDTVKSSVSTTLAYYVENLVLTGAANIDGSGNDQANRITGDAGNNRLDGKGGADVMAGGSGDDIYIVDDQADTVIEYGNGGIDTVLSSVSITLGREIENLVLTGAASIHATGNTLSNTLTGNAAANLLDGAEGADTLIGGLGDDTYLVDHLGDVVVENPGEGTDTVYATVNVTLAANVDNLFLAAGATEGSGNEQDNLLTGNRAANTLYGHAGDDTLDGGGGADSLIGGVGNDVYIVDQAGDMIVESAGEGNDTVVSGITYSLAHQPHLENIILSGTAATNATGNAAANRLIGNSAANTLSGGAGNDTLDGGAGADILIGGAGDDVYLVDHADDVVRENAGEGTDTVQSSLSTTIGANVENLRLRGSAEINGTGNAQSNIIEGNSANNIITGSGGNDLLVGGAGHDQYVFHVGDGLDTLVDTAAAKEGNTIVFGAGVLPEYLVFTEAHGALTIRYAASDAIVLPDFHLFDTEGNAASFMLRFANGDSISLAGLVNHAPVVTSALASQAASEDAAFHYQLDALAFSDVDDGDTLRFSASLEDGAALPAWLSFDAITRRFSGTPAFEDAGHLQLSVTATDRLGKSVSQRLDLSIARAIVPPAEVVVDGVTTGDDLTDQGAVKSVFIGGAGDDSLTGSTDNDILIGQAGDDMIDGLGGHDFLIGGSGNDTLVTSAGTSVMAFNAGHGQDFVLSAKGQGHTVSLGQGIHYADLLFTRTESDLTLVTGENAQLTFKDWYADLGKHRVTNLQMMIEDASDYAPDAIDPLARNKIAQFDFAGLADQFDQTRAVTPGLNSWALSSALLQFHLGGSDSEAIGGDLAYRYARDGNLSALSTMPATEIVTDAQFGTSQALRPMRSLQDLSPRLG